MGIFGGAPKVCAKIDESNCYFKYTDPGGTEKLTWFGDSTINVKSGTAVEGFAAIYTVTGGLLDSCGAAGEVEVILYDDSNKRELVKRTTTLQAGAVGYSGISTGPAVVQPNTYLKLVVRNLDGTEATYTRGMYVTSTTTSPLPGTPTTETTTVPVIQPKPPEPQEIVKTFVCPGTNQWYCKSDGFAVYCDASGKAVNDGVFTCPEILTKLAGGTETPVGFGEGGLMTSKTALIAGAVVAGLIIFGVIASRK